MRRPAAALVGLTIAALLAAAAPALAGSSAPSGRAARAAAKPLPSKDPFYRYDGHPRLARLKPGTVLKQRTVQVSLGTDATPVPATQLLYRTTDEQHHPAATVTTVLTPSTALAVPRLVAYLSFYDALGPECDPSYTLTGGYAGSSANEQQAEEEEGLIAAYESTEGAIVTIPDFEGTHLHWVAGQESGYSTLDAIRATEHALHLAASTPVGLTGYSGGSIAGDWASELAPHYAPTLNLVGVAEGGIPVDLAHNLRYINGSKGWSGVIPAVLVAAGRAFGVHVKHYLSKKGRRITHQVRNECIGSFNGAYPGLTVQSLLKHRYRHFLKQRVFVRIVNHLIMGSAPGHPHAPLFMAVGNADGTGDGVMVAKDVAGLAREYCKQGTVVQFAEYAGDSHVQAGLHFEPTAFTFLQQRLGGVPPENDCANLPAGNSLKPVPLPHKHHQKRTHHLRHG